MWRCPFNQRKNQFISEEWAVGGIKKQIVYCELLSDNHIINLDKYCLHLNELKQGIGQKWPELTKMRSIVLNQDNTRPHVPLATQPKLLQLN